MATGQAVIKFIYFSICYHHHRPVHFALIERRGYRSPAICADMPREATPRNGTSAKSAKPCWRSRLSITTRTTPVILPRRRRTRKKKRNIYRSSPPRTRRGTITVVIMANKSTRSAFDQRLGKYRVLKGKLHPRWGINHLGSCGFGVVVEKGRL